MSDIKLCIIGLGYVGLPLAVEFAKNRKVIGYDVNLKRISELRKNIDKTNEVLHDDLHCLSSIEFTNDIEDIRDCNCYIVTVPTPINKNNEPDLSYLRIASSEVGKILKKNDIVIYESTVFPGCTEEFCAPILEKVSGFQLNIDFYCGYSPERINPGDKDHRINNTVKIVSSSSIKVIDVIVNLYNEIVSVGTHVVSSIKVAESAKVIENTQRDLNIALVNELSVLFNKLNIDTEEVLSAADTKWNFHKFTPGLVGGHCIGVDPYYLTHKALSIGYIPEVILAGRKINNKMPAYVVQELTDNMIKKKIHLKDAKVLILGITFKENCPDIRNSKTLDVIEELENKNLKTYVYDPWVNYKDIENKITTIFLDDLKQKEGFFDAIIISVGHDIFRKMGINFLNSVCKKNNVIFDLKYVFKKEETDIRL
jgi:UDP-N-acetyl-D-glucosamine/UDP-N-acetyl-D-galactosamine dehydrogenase